jgi:signal transduction histidine kinase
VPALAVGSLVLVDALAMPPVDPPVPAWPAVAAAVVAVPLLVRVRHPEAVLVFLVTALSALTVLGTPVGNGVLGVAVALHAVAAQGVRRRALLDAALACAVLVTVTVLVDPREAGELAGPLLGIAGVALYVGDTARVTREHDASLAQRIADAALEEELRERVAVVDERTRLARELHDSIGHTLSLVILQAGAARLAAASPGAVDRVSDALRSIESCARSALEDLELAVTSMPGDEKGPVALAEDLHGVVAGVRAAGTRVTVDAAPTDDLPRSMQVAIVRITQEALTNVVKHAPGAAATVQVARSGDAVSVTVRNDRGWGTAPALPSGRRGITGMRERVSMFHGQLEAGPDGRGGHLVEARIPLPRDGGEPALPTVMTGIGGDRS